jgi:DNA-binding transcriptional LysR family regulator
MKAPEPMSERVWEQVHMLSMIARTGSLTKAAELLSLSKAAVSVRLQQLERSMGVTLVLRTTRSVGLTEAGIALVSGTAEMFERISEVVDQVRDASREPKGMVRVTAPVALGRQQVAPILDGFLRAHPKIRVELDLSDRIVNLVQEGFDLAIRHTSAPPDTHVATAICPTRTLLVASPSYLRRRGTPHDPRELIGHDCLMYFRRGQSKWMFEGPSQSGGDPERVSVDVSGPLKAGNSEILRDVALSGLGVAQIPDFSVSAALKAGRLREVLPEWRPVGFFGDTIYALRPWSNTVPKATQLFTAHIRGELAKGFG